MRVLLWHWGRRGGGPRYTYELARALRARDDVEVHLSLSRQSEWFGPSQALGLPGLPVDTYTNLAGFLAGGFRLPALRRQFTRYLRDNRVDVVLCTMVHVWNVAFLDVIRDAGCRYVFTVHDASLHPGEENRLREWALGRELDAADTVITLTDHVRRSLVDLRGLDPARIHVVPHGVFDYAGGDETPTPLAPPLRLLFFGRILPYKGLDILLQAYRRLRGEGVPVTLTIAGEGSLASFRAGLHDLPDVTIRNDWIPENAIGEILAAHHVVVQTYTEASQSGVIPSAFSAGRPVVVTPVGGLVEQVRDGVDGLVAADVTADAVVACVRRLADDPSLLDTLSQNALSAARTTLSWNTIGDGVLMAIRPSRNVDG